MADKIFLHFQYLSIDVSMSLLFFNQRYNYGIKQMPSQW